MKQVADHGVSTVERLNPLAIHPGWVMAYMLVVSTTEMSDPVPVLVFKVSRDRLFHSISLSVLSCDIDLFSVAPVRHIGVQLTREFFQSR